MRITTNTIFNRLTRSLNDNLVKLYEVSNRLSTGKKINKPSDDASGLTRALDYKISINEIEQYKKNIDGAYSYLDFTDTTMSSATNILTRARELAVEASTGTQTPESRAAIAEEIASLRDQVLSLANSKFGNRYIFSGYRTGTEAFDPTFNYQGDSGSINIITDRNSTMALNITGDVAFSYGGTSYMETLDTFYNDLLNDNEAGIQASVSDFENALDQVANVRAEIGAKLNNLDSLKTGFDNRDVTLQTFLSDTEDSDIALDATELEKTELALESLRMVSSDILSRSLLDFLS